MRRRIVIVQGHPDPAGRHLCHALADAYAAGAEAAGHDLRRLEVARLDVPLLRSKAEFEGGVLPAHIAAAQEDLAWAEHLLFLYPLWLGAMPALLKGFLEQTLRPGFAFEAGRMRGRLTGRSARVVVTMGMPVLAYRWWFGAHSLKAFERNILRFVGIRPVRESLFGSVETVSDATRAAWLARLRALGAAGR
jgi:putative NADPH-quinone reductase